MKRLLVALALLLPSLAVGQNPPTPTKPAPGPTGVDPSDLDATNTISVIGQTATDAARQRQIAANTLGDPTTRARAETTYQQDLNKIQNAGDTHPQSAPINIAGGKALVDLGEPKRSLPLLDRAVDLSAAKDDKNTLSQALFARAGANVQLRDFPAITRDADRVLSYDPNNQYAQLLLKLYSGRVASTGGPAQAPPPADDGAGSGGGPNILSNSAGRGSATTLMTQTASQIEGARYVRLAADKAGLGDKAAAKQLLDKALSIDPKNVGALLARAKSAKSSGDAAASLADASAAAQIDPAKAEAYFLKGEAKKALNYPAADYAADYAKAAELDPSFSQAELAALAGAAPQASSMSGEAAAAAAAARAKAAGSRYVPVLTPVLRALPPVVARNLTSILFVAVGVGFILAAKLSAKRRE